MSVVLGLVGIAWGGTRGGCNLVGISDSSVCVVTTALFKAQVAKTPLQPYDCWQGWRLSWNVCLNGPPVLVHRCYYGLIMFLFTNSIMETSVGLRLPRARMGVSPSPLRLAPSHTAYLCAIYGWLMERLFGHAGCFSIGLSPEYIIFWWRCDSYQWAQIDL